MKKFTERASKDQIDRAMEALQANGIAPYFATDGASAKAKILELIPAGAEVMTMTSMTLDALGIANEINESGRYNSLRANKLSHKDVTPSEKRKLGGGPDWTVGSVHALTEDGKLMIASNTGSQLGAYAYGAGTVLWVIGAQKIVANVDEGMRRIYEHVLPLERERAHKAYGSSESDVSKLLIFNKEVARGRAIAIIVNEVLGF